MQGSSPSRPGKRREDVQPGSMLTKNSPRGILDATSKRFGPSGAYGAAAHRRRNISHHHSVGLLQQAAPGSPANGYDAGGYGGYTGAYDHGYGHQGYSQDYGGYSNYEPSGAYGKQGSYDQNPGGYGDDFYGGPPGYPQEPEGGEEEFPEGEPGGYDAAAAEPCKCPSWDPMSDAKPEDLQHASLVMLQRRSRPEHRLTKGLRRAAAAVDTAGRDFERWIRKRQELAQQLPKLRKILAECKKMDDERDKEEVQEDVEELRTIADEEKAQAKAAMKQAELNEEDLVVQKTGHMQGKVDHWAFEQAMHKQDAADAQTDAQTVQAVNAYNQQGGDLQQQQVEEAQKELGYSFLDKALELFWGEA
ncbi:unnamed protein product [Symbiodinium pilosum]|uniref:Uncharacterized protein n=1 Tax=Symbiodinium pilosum TaxID=2952 RepID=A0A812JUQ3_SYMPI|nr:unnamed protein product [Symbiodinium pilosum]